MALLSEAELYEASHLVCQMATQAFCRALQADADVVISQPGLRRGAGRWLECARGPAMHMATIIECAAAAFQAAATRSWHCAERRARRRGGCPRQSSTSC